MLPLPFPDSPEAALAQLVGAAALVFDWCLLLVVAFVLHRAGGRDR